MPKRILVMAYAAASYVVAFLALLYAVGFIANLYVPRSIDSPPTGDLATGLAIDLGVLLLFALQHSLMARPAFKRVLTRFIPAAAERSTYVLASGLALVVLFAFWRPLGGAIWSIEGGAALALHLLCAFGWLLLLASTFMLNHFDLFGLRQAWLFARGRAYRPVAFATPGPYRLVRHPLYVGWIFASWATPTMTATHLLFAVATTVYILVAIRFEERDLVVHLGDAYRDYRRRVPMLIPFTRRSTR